ncbi:PhoX family protein [Helicobacter sp. WB40]|uniref:PhoX family protein n=1 Tax=Helicobacter sp. WB40 TaxID=3004130 RepID=UPI0022EBDA0F|nr:PhoX family phosphatase [Helicobacter sp. WB40]MDA3966529.1 PhoX family phosphatase [Helicobacter sp. WB40]
MQRRNFMKILGVSTASLSYASFFGASILNAKENKLLGFESIDINTKDIVVVPKDYEVKPLISWGDPLFSSAKEFDESKIINEDSINNATLTFGDNTDGMSVFELSEDSYIMCVNNEYINPEHMFNHNGKNMTLDDVRYEQNSLGVSIFEIKKDKNGDFNIVKDSKYNRRITAHTPMEVSTLRGFDRIKTKDDKNGERILGTINNCANGKTPWGTYLACEENFDDFFGSSNKKLELNESEKRYGVGVDSVYKWELDSRFDISKNRNEPNRFGYVVEIDPYNPNSTPIKRCALGRFKHENAEVLINKDGHVVVYMGDDEVNEFIYKFVSKNKFDSKNNKNNRNLLESGTLYVAKFTNGKNELEGTGEWIELSYGKNGLIKENGFFSYEDILIDTRLAASFVGATPMDRPEWIVADNNSRFVYATLTNNTKRTEAGAANPRVKNQYGHIIRWWHKDNNHNSTKFKWDIFLLAGNPMQYPNDLRKGTSNITKDNMFNSPDGLAFDKFGRLWIETDGKYSNEGDFLGMGNNQLLCANPNTGEVRRFLSGPIGCEITGIAFSKDYKTMFIGIQHPGENLLPSHYPNGGDSTPRSTIVQIRHKNGNVIGS